MTMPLIQPAATVAICTHNRCEQLRRAIAGVLQQADGLPLRLLVVDNASADGTAKVIAEAAAQIPASVDFHSYRETKLGLAHARNAALDRAVGEFIVFLDDDAVPSSHWLRAYVEAFADPQVGIVVGRTLPEFEVTPPAWVDQPGLMDFFSVLDLGDQSRAMTAQEQPVGANMAFRRSVVGDLRFRPELGRRGTSLLSGEETVFVEQLRAGGARMAYCAAAEVHHHVLRERLSLRWILRRSYYQGETEILAGRKKAKWSTAIWESLRTPVSMLLAAVLVRDSGRRVGAWCRAAYRWGVAMAGWRVLSARRSSAVTRTSA